MKLLVVHALTYTYTLERHTHRNGKTLFLPADTPAADTPAADAPAADAPAAALA